MANEKEEKEKEEERPLSKWCNNCYFNRHTECTRNECGCHCKGEI